MSDTPKPRAQNSRLIARAKKASRAKKIEVIMAVLEDGAAAALEGAKELGTFPQTDARLTLAFAERYVHEGKKATAARLIRSASKRFNTNLPFMNRAVKVLFSCRKYADVVNILEELPEPRRFALPTGTLVYYALSFWRTGDQAATAAIAEIIDRRGDADAMSRPFRELAADLERVNTPSLLASLPELLEHGGAEAGAKGAALLRRVWSESAEGQAECALRTEQTKQRYGQAIAAAYPHAPRPKSTLIVGDDTLLDYPLGGVIADETFPALFAAKRQDPIFRIRGVRVAAEPDRGMQSVLAELEAADRGFRLIVISAGLWDACPSILSGAQLARISASRGYWAAKSVEDLCQKLHLHLPPGVRGAPKTSKADFEDLATRVAIEALNKAKTVAFIQVPLPDSSTGLGGDWRGNIVGFNEVLASVARRHKIAVVAAPEDAANIWMANTLTMSRLSGYGHEVLADALLRLKI